MFKRRVIALCGTLAALAAGSLASGPMVAQAGESAGVTTAAYGNLRDDWDPNEPALSPAAVQSASFGKLFSTKLRGAIYAQPLVYDGDVIVTTEKAYAYAINATSGEIVWKRSFGKPFTRQHHPLLGSEARHRVHLDPGDRTEHGRHLHDHAPGGRRQGAQLRPLEAAGDLGRDRRGGAGYPVSITGTPSNTPGVPFNESYQQQRPALLLLNGASTSRLHRTATSPRIGGSSSA